MDFFKKVLIFLIVSFKLLVYIINTTISSSSLIVYLYLFIIILMSLIYIFKLRFNKTSFIKIMTIIIISFIIFIIYKEDNIFLYTLLGLILIDEKNEDIVKIIFESLSIVFILTVLLGVLNILPVSEAYRTIDGETQIRTSLGFPNANAAFAYFIPIVLSGLYLFKNNKIFTFLALVSASAIYSFTMCRTGFYLVLIILLVNLFIKNTDSGKFNKNIFMICFVLSVLLALLFGTTKYNSINELLSFRPWYCYQFLKQGIFIWGSGIPENLILDNLFFKLLANYSIIGISLYYYVYKQGRNICSSDKYLLFSMIFFTIYNIFEAMTIGNFVLIVFLKEIIKSYGVVYEKD